MKDIKNINPANHNSKYSNFLVRDGDRIIIIVKRVNSKSQLIFDVMTGYTKEVECQDYEPLTKEEEIKLLKNNNYNEYISKI